MVTILDNRRDRAEAESYSTYREPDTRVPPRARPVLGAISVNGVGIAEADILLEAQNHPAADPGAALAAAARALVVRELLLQRAAALGVTPLPCPDADGRVEADEDAAIRALIEREVSVPSATGPECLRFYRNNPERFRSAPIFEARHILLAADPSDARARTAARGEAERLAALLARNPHDFAAVARAHSACPSSAEGGNLGQVTRGSTVSEFEAALDALAEGETTVSPVESRFGFHIIRLDRRIEGAPLPFDAIRERIAAWLEASAWSKAVSQLIAILAADADIVGIDMTAAEGPLLQ